MTVTASRTRAWASYALMAVGLLQAIGWVSGLDALRGLGAMSVASPLPFVFSSFRGLETFAADFEIELVGESGARTRHVITPALYSKLDGPYNRRNTYGAVLAYGPALDAPDERHWVGSVLSYGLCGQGPLARRFGAVEPIAAVNVEVRSKARGGGPPFRRELPCSD